MDMTNAGAAMYLYLAVAAFSFFAFLAVASWSNARRREREAFYRSKTLKKSPRLEPVMAVQRSNSYAKKRYRNGIVGARG